MESIFSYIKVGNQVVSGAGCWYSYRVLRLLWLGAAAHPQHVDLWTVELWHCGRGVASVYIELMQIFAGGDVHS